MAKELRTSHRRHFLSREHPCPQHNSSKNAELMVSADPGDPVAHSEDGLLSQEPLHKVNYLFMRRLFSKMAEHEPIRLLFVPNNKSRSPKV